MNILGRFPQVIRSQVNRWVQGPEDPEKILDQVVISMQQDLIQLRQAVAQAITTQKRTERQCQQSQTLGQEWYNRAQMALSKGNESEARAALVQRHAYLQIQTRLANHLREHETVIAKLKTNMRGLEIKIFDVRTRRDIYVARARSAEASQRIQAMIAQASDTCSMEPLSAIADQILDLETKAETMAKMNNTLELEPLESKFAALQSGETTAIETELAAMKVTLPNI